MAPVSKKVLEELKKLYKVSQTARTMLDYLAGRERNARRSPVERICAVIGLSRADVIDLFRKFEELGFGRFLVGRRGQPSRFEWDVAMVSVGQAATGETSDIATDDIEDVAEEVAIGSDGLKHTFRLRTDFPVEFELPANLTPAEAVRLADFIKTLPFGAGS